MDRDRRTILYLAYAVSITGVTGNSLIAPAIPDVLDDLGRSEAAAGMLIAAVSLPGIVMAPVIGLLADRFGRRAVLCPCLFVFGLGGLIASIAPSFAVIVAARFVMGFGAAGLVNLAVVLIGDHFDGSQRTTLLGRNAAMLTAGLAVLPFLAGAIAQVAGWRWAVLPNALGMVMALVAWRVLPGGRPDHAGTLCEQLGGLGVVLRRPTIMVVLGCGTLIFFVIFGAFLTVIPIHLEEDFGFEAGLRGAMLGLPAVASSAVGFNLGRIRARWGLRAVLVTSGLTWIVAFALLAASPLVAMLVVGCLLYGMGEGAFIPTLQDVAITNAPPEHRGGVVAMWVGFARLGQTVGPLVAAGIAGATSSSTALATFVGVSAVLTVLLAVAPLRSSAVGDGGATVTSAAAPGP
jgi:ACDE family multidrug resistance protein